MTNYRIYSEPKLNPSYVILEIDGIQFRRKYCTSSWDIALQSWWWNFRIKSGWNPTKDIYSGKIK